MGNAGNGETYKWIVHHKDYELDSCLIWPFARDAANGYGQMGYLGKSYWVHRLMCETAHGLAPTPKHQAAHSCGRGHEGCANPRHLSWKTRSENNLDCRKHGTSVRSRYGSCGKLKPHEVEEIRAARGLTSRIELAAKFGVSVSTISNAWTGLTFKRPSKLNYFTAEEDAQIREFGAKNLSYNEMGKLMGRCGASISRRAKKLGIASGYVPPKPGQRYQSRAT